jgi:hypothetical protein
VEQAEDELGPVHEQRTNEQNLPSTASIDERQDEVPMLWPNKPALPLRYIVYLKNGRTRRIVDYWEDDGHYHLQYPSGAFLPYDKNSIVRIQQIIEDDEGK